MKHDAIARWRKRAWKVVQYHVARYAKYWIPILCIAMVLY
jgi:hypothetical protein